MEARVGGWENFYVIVGSSGAALIGLQFVVMTLIAGMRRRTDPGALSAFGTPTVVHLSGALLIGIHNSWDTVTHLVVGLARDAGTTPSEVESEATPPVQVAREVSPPSGAGPGG